MHNDSESCRQGIRLGQFHNNNIIQEVGFLGCAMDDDGTHPWILSRIVPSGRPEPEAIVK